MGRAGCGESHPLQPSAWRVAVPVSQRGPASIVQRLPLTLFRLGLKRGTKG